MPVHGEPGILVTFEGIDGTGKTTQIKLLASLLQQAGLGVTTSREPTEGPWGQRLRKSASTGRLAPADELEAFIHDREEHVANLIRPALARGDVVILDRYYHSTIAYQGSRGIGVDSVRDTMEKLFPIPDAVFLLDLDPQVALDRISTSRSDSPNAFEKLESLAKVRAVFLQLHDPSIIRIDAGLSAESLHQEVVRHFIEGPLRKHHEWWNISRRLAAVPPKADC